MLCPFCNTARLDNDAPCPYCGAPSPLQRPTAAPAHTGTGSQGFWGNPQPPSAFSPVQPLAMPQGMPETPVQTPNEQQQRQSLLPALYQPPMGMIPRTEENMNTNALAPAQEQSVADLLAAMPGAEHVTYIAPMYTRPRAIIPRYRAISGLISVIVVALLLCAGLGYYAKASGKLNVLAQTFGFAPPPNVELKPTLTLTIPKTVQVPGPAYNIINSATTTAQINTQHVAIEQDTRFHIGQTIYLTYSVQHPKSPGVVTIKWYTNGLFYQEAPPTPRIDQPINGYTSEQFQQPANGKVEIYWNNELAITLYFVVV